MEEWIKEQILTVAKENLQDDNFNEHWNARSLSFVLAQIWLCGFGKEPFYKTRARLIPQQLKELGWNITETEHDWLATKENMQIAVSKDKGRVVQVYFDDCALKDEYSYWRFGNDTDYYIGNRVKKFNEQLEVIQEFFAQEVAPIRAEWQRKLDGVNAKFQELKQAILKKFPTYTIERRIHGGQIELWVSGGAWSVYYIFIKDGKLIYAPYNKEVTPENVCELYNL